MATQAFFFAPEAPLPIESDARWESTVQSWLSLVTDAWFERWESLPEDEQARVPRFVGGTGLSKNAAAATRTNDRALRDSAARWVEAEWARYAAGGRAELPVADVAACHDALGIASKVAVNDLLHYRGEAREIPAKRLPRGAKLGYFRHNRGADEFDMVPSDGTELTIAREIARAAGGDVLLAWSYGRAVAAALVRGARGHASTVHGPFALRIAGPAEGARGLSSLDDLRAVMKDGPMDLPWSALEAAQSGPALAVGPWFEALGVPKAAAPDPVDAPAIWDAFEAVTAALLQGQEPDRALLRRAQAALGDDLKLPAKPEKVPKRSLATLANAAGRLALYLGTRPAQGPVASLAEATAPVQPHVATKMSHARDAIASAPAPRAIPHWRALQRELPPTISYRGRLDEQQGGLIALRVGLSSAAEARALREDLRGRSLVASYGETWIDGGAVWGYACAYIERDVLIATLGDLPAGTSLAIASGPEVLGHWTR